MIEFDGVLNKIKEEGYFRKRTALKSAQDTIVTINGKKYINFASNNYLNLANNQKLKKIFKKSISEYGVGSGSSPLVSGYSDEHLMLESELAKYTKFQSSIVTNSGYLSNVGLINAISERNMIIFQDKMNHNSIIEGSRLSNSHLIRFKHKDYDDLANKIKKYHSHNKIIYVDAVFSMTGELSQLDELSAIAKENKALLIVDDAHGFGVIKKNETHFPSILSLYKRKNISVDAYIGTFGKAAGTFGSFIAANKNITQLIIQKSKPYIYSTSLPAALVKTTRESLKIIKQDKKLHAKLNRNIKYFRSLSKCHGVNIGQSETPIQTITIGDPKKVVFLQKKALEAGIFLQAIRYPTVPRNRDLLRISITAGQTTKHIEKLLNFLKRI